MISRSAIQTLLITSLLALSFACNGAPTPRPRRPEPERRTTERARPRVPAKPAPRGPDVSGSVTLSFELDGLARLDKRILSILPPLFKRFARGQALRRMLPDLARSLGLNSLALDALDQNRPSAFALLVKPHPRRGVHLQMLAALPIKGDGKLVEDGLRASYDSVTRSDWGGLQIKNGGETVAWVRVHKGWAVAAPTAPLLDSAFRYLVPRAKALPRGHARAHLNAQHAVRALTPLVKKFWGFLSARPGGAAGDSFLRRWMALHLTDIEKLGTHLASLDSLALEVEVDAKAWRWQLDAMPVKGGVLARWMGKQKAGAGFGLKVLPAKPMVAVSDWVAPELRSLILRLVSGFTSIQLDRITRRLPRQVALRGLYKRKRPASLYLYRRTLRDLNLKDYRASHKVYVVLWHVHAFRRHLAKTLPPLLKTATGKFAGAVYTPAGPGLGLASVAAIKNRRQHQRLYTNALWGTLQNLNRLARSAWKLADKRVQKFFGKRPFFQFVFRQTALRVGRVPVSAVALRIKWPKRPRGTLTPRQQRDHAALARYRKIVETVLGTGDLTWAWAYVGKRVLTSAGRGWKPRITAMVKAATGKGGATLATDRHFNQGLKKPAGATRLGVLMFSATRLAAAVMQSITLMHPRAKGSMQMTLLSSIIQRDAKAARAGTLAEVLRHRGGYRIQSVLPATEMRSLAMSVGYLLFGMVRSSAPMKRPSMPVPARAAPPHHP